jgi:hypothetical protein
MRTADYIALALAAGTAIAAHYFPDASQILYIIAGGLVGKALPQPSTYLQPPKKEDKP